MPKMKTKKALAKRVKRTGSGKLKRSHAYISHFAANKTCLLYTSVSFIIAELGNEKKAQFLKPL